MRVWSASLCAALIALPLSAAVGRPPTDKECREIGDHAAAIYDRKKRGQSWQSVAREVENNTRHKPDGVAVLLIGMVPMVYGDGKLKSAEDARKAFMGQCAAIDMDRLLNATLPRR